MNDKEYMALSSLPSGSSGIIENIAGGHGMINRLNAIGIRPGKKVMKISSMMMRGPVTIDMDGNQVAIGFGMAKRIIVKLTEPLK